MLKIIRWMLGLCDHHYAVVSIEDVKWNASMGGLIACDLAKAGTLHHRNYTQACQKCAKVKVNRIKV